MLALAATEAKRILIGCRNKIVGIAAVEPLISGGCHYVGCAASRRHH
jgi:hypothetical protein